MIAEDEPDWRTLWQDYLAFYEAERPDNVYAETWRRIQDTNEEMFAMVAETQEHGVIGIVNFLQIIEQLKRFTVVEFGWQDIVRSSFVRDYIMTKEMMQSKQ